MGTLSISCLQPRLAFAARFRREFVAKLLVAVVVAGCGGKSTSAPTRPPPPDASSAGSAEMNLPLDAGQCRGNADCNHVTSCVEPGGAPSGALCFPATCNVDAECQAMGANYVCDPLPAACGEGKSCFIGCASSVNCASGQVCEQAHCVQPQCQKDADCATNFLCSTGRCVRKSCTADTACSVYCVKALCYSEPGTCQPSVL
jgi:hypothetical protein